MALLEVKDLKTYFKTQEGTLKAVDGIDFNLDKGQAMGLAGESGCGKTTAALSIMKLLPANGYIAGGWMLSDPRIVRGMTRTAEKNRIPYQREVLLGGTTDARAMQLVRSGVPVGCISIPCRYVHTASEMVDMDDVENAVKLIVTMLRSPVIRD